MNARCASTASHASPFTDIKSEYPPDSSISTFSQTDFPSTTFDDVASSAPASVHEHIGYLKELGLDYGWGPTAMMETLLENVHIYTGTPWWASIGISLILIRVCLLKIYINAADAAARNQLIAHMNTPLMENLKTAQKNRDTLGVQKAMADMKDLRAAGGVKISRMFMPFIQIPIGFGFFRLMRGMSYLPVPGLDTGGIFWLQDLTMSDPYFILPLGTAGCYYYAFKAGGEMGNNAMMNPQMANFFRYALPIFSGVIMTYWPGALQLTFFIQAWISMVQSAALRQPWFREYLGIQPLPKAKPNEPPGQVYTGTINRATKEEHAPEMANKSILGRAQAGIKDAFSSIRDKVSEYQQQQAKPTGRRTTGELKHAKAYDARRRREIAQAQFEREQEAADKLMEDQERRKGRKGKLRQERE